MAPPRTRSRIGWIRARPRCWVTSSVTSESADSLRVRSALLGRREHVKLSEAIDRPQARLMVFERDEHVGGEVLDALCPNRPRTQRGIAARAVQDNIGDCERALVHGADRRSGHTPKRGDADDKDGDDYGSEYGTQHAEDEGRSLRSGGLVDDGVHVGGGRHVDLGVSGSL